MSPLLTSSKYRQTTNKKLIRLIAIVLMIMTVLSSIGALQSNAAANFNISNSTLSTTDVAADGKIVMNIKVNGTGTVNQYAYWYRRKANLHGMLLLHLTGYHQITLLCIRADIQGLCLILIPDGLFD